MIKPDYKITPAILKQISQIERLAGNWERISETIGSKTEKLRTQSLESSALCSFLLDSKSTSLLTFSIPKRQKSANLLTKIDFSAISNAEDFQNHLQSFSLNFQPTMENVFFIYQKNIGRNSELDVSEQTNGKFQLTNQGLDTSLLRTAVEQFVVPPADRLASYSSEIAKEDFFLPFSNENTVFTAISPFLIENKLKELLSWLEEETSSPSFHPLLTLAVFHLLFLQIHPFQNANHRLSLLILRSALINSGFSFIEFTAFPEQFLLNYKRYFSALRQAEKTCGENFSTLNIWIDFFLSSIEKSGRELIEKIDLDHSRLRLTPVQKKILSVIKERGLVSRDQIARDTDIKLSTVKYNLSVLSNRGQLVREGGGRSTCYRLI